MNPRLPLQSCHGKGPSDSEGAAVKCALRRVELRGEYFADTAPAVEWLEEHLTITERPCAAAYKHRHTIGKRTFHLVGAGVVDHNTDTANAVDGIKSSFSIDAYADMQIKYGELTCSCDGCQGRSWEPTDVGTPLGPRPPCSGTPPGLFERTDLEMRVADPARRLRGPAIDKYLLDRAQNAILCTVKQGDFALAYVKPDARDTGQEHRRVRLVEVVGDERVAEKYAGGRRETVGGTLMPPSTRIIDVAWSECVADHDGTFEFPRAALCTNRLAQCGPGRLNLDGTPNPCGLRHRDPIPITALRPPILSGDFRVIELASADDQPRRLRLTPGALQEVSSVLEDDIQLGLYVN